MSHSITPATYKDELGTILHDSTNDNWELNPPASGKASFDDDLRLAQQIAEEEERQYADFIKSIEEKDDGIVFSVSINAEDGTLEDGCSAHPDDLERFQPWRELFDKTGGRKITKFHWFVNPELERRFEAARAVIESLGRPGKEELMLFHGTAEPNFDSILKGGLRVGGTYGIPLTHGCQSGVGIYLAERAASAIGYTHGANKIFACRVIPGKITTNVEHVRKIPKLEVGQEKYDSYYGPYVKSNVYVVRCADLVLPCYMIEFEASNPEVDRKVPATKPVKTSGKKRATPIEKENPPTVRGSAKRLKPISKKIVSPGRQTRSAAAVSRRVAASNSRGKKM